MPSASLADLSWPQVVAARDAGHRTVVFAAGSTEQHGPHLPLRTDTLLGDALAAGVAERLGVVSGPTIPFGVSPHHMAFCGTITLRPSTFKAMTLEYVDSLAAHGFETILAIPSHGGNFAPLRELAEETDGHVGDARLIAYTDLQEFVSVLAQVGQAEGVPAEVSGSHAGEAETSLVLAMRPDLVDMSEAVAGFTRPFDPETESRLFSEGTRALSEVGVLGDSRPADARRGQRYLDALVDRLTLHFQACMEADTKVSHGA